VGCLYRAQEKPAANHDDHNQGENQDTLAVNPAPQQGSPGDEKNDQDEQQGRVKVKRVHRLRIMENEAGVNAGRDGILIRQSSRIRVKERSGACAPLPMVMMLFTMLRLLAATVTQAATAHATTSGTTTAHLATAGAGAATKASFGALRQTAEHPVGLILGEHAIG